MAFAPTPPTAEYLTSLTPGDRVTVHYSSVYNDADHDRFTARVVDVEQLAGEKSRDIRVRLAPDGDDERQWDEEVTRRYHAAYFDGEFSYADVDTKNVGRWNRLSEFEPEPVLEREESA